MSLRAILGARDEQEEEGVSAVAGSLASGARLYDFYVVRVLPPPLPGRIPMGG
jgi:hypothetical protein